MDTSAFAKRYIKETGSQWTRQLMTENQIVVSEISTIEFQSLIASRQRNHNISKNLALTLNSLFSIHLRTQFRTVKTNTEVYQTARTVLDQHPLRALDTIQLASAIVGQRIIGTQFIFVSADTRLLTAAQGEGFQTDNPLNHP